MSKLPPKEEDYEEEYEEEYEETEAPTVSDASERSISDKSLHEPPAPETPKPTRYQSAKNLAAKAAKIGYNSTIGE